MSWNVLLDLVVVLLGALLAGLIVERLLKQSAIVGFLLAGTVLGPGALDLVSGTHVVEAMAEIGVALLLFTTGLEFSWGRLRRFGPLAVGGGTLQVGVTLVVAAATAMAVGLDIRSAVAVGAMIALSSTACVLRVLADRAELDSLHGRASVGVLLIQDLALLPLVLLVTTLGNDAPAATALRTLAWTAGLAVGLVGAIWLVSNRLLPRLFAATHGTGNRDLPILLAAVVAFGSSWAAHALGLPTTLGAFVAGLVLAETPYATQVRSDVGVLRTLFVALFFASVGMLADPRWILEHALEVAALVIAIVLGKTLLAWPVLRLFGMTHRHAVASALCLAQVGEFSFVLAGAALAQGLLLGDQHQLLVSATIATLLATPPLVVLAPRVGRAVERALVAMRLARRDAEESRPSGRRLRDHVIVVGLGPAGQGVIDALRDAVPDVVVLDMNPKAVEAAAARGVIAHVGDAAREEVLEHAGIYHARGLAVTIPDYRAATQVVAQARAMVPELEIVARARYHTHVDELRRAGAAVVVDEEHQVGRMLGQQVLRHLRRDHDMTISGGAGLS